MACVWLFCSLEPRLPPWIERVIPALRARAHACARRVHTKDQRQPCSAWRGGETWVRSWGLRRPALARPFSVGDRDVSLALASPVPLGAHPNCAPLAQVWGTSPEEPSREVESPRLPRARLQGLGCRRRRRRPVPKTLLTAACVPRGFREPSWAGETRAEFALRAIRPPVK